jgi:hypothetical protein
MVGMRRLLRPLLVLLAIVFLIEAWLWRHLKPVVAGIVALIPLRRIKRRLKAAVEWLPPPAALVVFAVPALLLFPLKLVAVWLIAHKYWLSATVVFGFAKLAGLGVTAFVFEMTKPKLLQMAWFRWLYLRVLDWLAWAHSLTDPIKRRIRKLMRLVAPGRGSRALRLLWRIRRRMQAARAEARASFRSNGPRAARSAQSP